MRLDKDDRTARYRTSLFRLMPRGYAWPRQKGSVQHAWVHTLASECSEFENYTYRVIEQWWPHQTCTRVDEWCQATGLPDKCFPDADEIELRTQMLARLSGVSDLPYADSSPAAPAVIEAMCAAIGYKVNVWYNVPFRVGRNRVGQRLGALDGQLNVEVIRVCEPFRVGRNTVGQRLVMCTQDSQDLICFLQRIVPARFAIRTIF